MFPVLLLHGALGSKFQLEPLKTSLEANGLQVYSMNFSSHSGEAVNASFGIDTFARDVLRFLDNTEKGKVNIFGYSMGGYVALWLAHTHPSRIDKIITLGTKFDWTPSSAEKEVRKMDPDKLEEKVPAFARILERRHAPNDWKKLLRKTAAMMTELGNKPLLTDEILRHMKTRILILLGDQDDMADRRYSAKTATALPNGRFVLLENTPHPIEKVDLEMLQLIVQEEFR